MIKKTVKYTDFNGNENEETFYFNLTKAELASMEIATQGGMSNYIEEVVKSGDNKKLLEIFNEILLNSYGVKSEDGKRFKKSPELKESFAESAAFSEIFIELVSDPDAATAFMKGVTNQA